MGDPSSESSGSPLPAAAWVPPWEWNTVTIRALMKVRGDSARTLARDVYVVGRAVEGWLYNGRSPSPGSAKELYRLWAELEPWQREVFDALRAHSAGVEATKPVSPGSLRGATTVPTLGPRLAHMAADETPRSLAMWGEAIDVAISRRMMLAALGDAMAAIAVPITRAELPTRIAPEIAGYFRSQLAGHYRADLRLGPIPLLGTVAAQYQVVNGLAGVATGELRRELLGLSVAYAVEAGWLYQDAGDLARSTFWHAEALEMAHRAHDPQLVGYVLTRMAMLRTDQRDGQGVIDLAEEALANPRELCPKVQANAMQQAANGYSLRNNRDECDRLLDQKAKLIDRIDDEYPWGNGCRLYPEVQRATCYGRLHLWTEAVQLWERLLAHVPPTSHRRDYGVYRARQAVALAGSQEPEQAVHVAAEVVPIAAETGSARMRGELVLLRERMAPWRHEQVGRDLDEVLKGLPSPGARPREEHA